VYAHVPQALRAESDPWELDINDFQVSLSLSRFTCSLMSASLVFVLALSLCLSRVRWCGMGQLGKTLGEGAYGTVNMATYQGSVCVCVCVCLYFATALAIGLLHVRSISDRLGKTVAIKRMHASLLKPQDIKAFKKEAKLVRHFVHRPSVRTSPSSLFDYAQMKSLKPHPNVVGLVGKSLVHTRARKQFGDTRANTFDSSLAVHVYRCKV
jgi:hypothetical protein